MTISRLSLGVLGGLILAMNPACVAGSDDGESDESGQDAVAQAVITGITAIDAQNSADAHVLVDGQTGYAIAQWASTNIYAASGYPMRAVFDLGKAYDVSKVELFHGNGTGTINVKYLPVGADSSSDANYKLVEAHGASLWNAWETVAQSSTFSTRYIELTIASAATLYNASEIRVTGAPSNGTTPPPPPPPTTGLTKVATGEYQSFFLVDGKIWALGYGENVGITGESKGVPLPIATPAGLKFIDIQSGLHQTAAVDVNGNVWMFGTNNEGACGNGSIGGEITTPTKITSDVNGAAFDHVVSVSSHIQQSAALKSDGSMWFWGGCGKNICGSANTGSNPRPIPIPLPSGVKIKQFSMAASMLAVSTDGRVFAWGNKGGYGNDYDMSTGGDGSTAQQVQGLPANIVEVATATDFNYALTASGELWGWGVRGDFMGIADGHGIHPTNLSVSLGLAAPVKDVNVNDETTHVVLTDGSLWGWGANGQGEVGNLSGPDYAATQGNYSVWGGTQVMQTLPVRIAPSVHNFAKVFSNATVAFYTFAMTSDQQLYFMGRNKTGIAGDGIYPAAASGNYYAGEDVCASYPNSWDVTLAKHVSPMTLTVGTPVLSPYCVAHPNTAPCNDQ